jgi:hypothetical protein
LLRLEPDPDTLWQEVRTSTVSFSYPSGPPRRGGNLPVVAYQW